MNCIFTIIAKNYLGLAKVLEASVQKHAPAASFFIFIADEPAKEQEPETLPENVFIAKKIAGIGENAWQEMAFKYSLVEFCTAIKPACFKFLFSEKGAQKAIYLDPDIFVFNSFDDVYQQLDAAPVLLTPHILNMQTPFRGNYADHLFLLNGTFNLGFLALKKSSTADRFLNWWHDRLKNECFFDNDRGTATDQKWINLLPALFPANEYSISRHAGLNVAPWNFHEREVYRERETFFVKERSGDAGNSYPLVFVHFSGYDYSGIQHGQAAHKSTGMAGYQDFEPVFDSYAEALRASQFADYVSNKYSYAAFDNGATILSLHRRIFRRLLANGENISNPFSTGEGSFYRLLFSKGLIDRSAVPADKLTNKTVKNFSSRLGYVHLFFRFIKSIIGIRKYSILIRFMRRYFSEENQAFLAEKDAVKKLW